MGNIILVIVLFVGIVAFSFLLRFKFFRVLLSAFIYLLRGLLFVFFSGILIAFFSLISGVLILFSHVISDRLFLLNGEPITIANMNEVIFAAITFGTLFYVLYIIGTIIFSFIPLHQISYVVFTYFTAIVVHTMLYPIILTAIFSEMSISFIGALYLNVAMILVVLYEIFIRGPLQRRRTSRRTGRYDNYNQRQQRRRDGRIWRENIFPWIHHRRRPVNE